ncbi:MAG: hypothetical protein K6E98_07845 [Lachnospiraceae bacterium]|nr:hypothetical protein [Lachnospiraceae bacterium]
MADEYKKIDDEAMENINGGKASFSVSDKGVVTMIDKNGVRGNFSPAEWAVILDHYSYMKDGALSCILDVPYEDLKMFLINKQFMK